ncbi:MAG TPA: pyridoxamine 5'-phosphate oxidase family protein, partial [Burkholderiaceae bacterium]
MSARLRHLDEIEQCIWSELESCVASRPHRREPGVEAGERIDEPAAEPAATHEWRVAALATATDDEQADCVVLREVDAPEHRLVFYTDARSPRVKQLEASQRGTLVFRSRALGQVRMRVRLAVETTGLAVSSRWARLQ